MLKEKVKTDLITTMKEQRQWELETLRLLLAAIERKEMEKAGTVLNDEQIVELVFSEIKKRKEAIEFYLKGGRQELADKEQAELSVLQRYLPAQLSDEALKKIVANAVKATGATAPKDFGKVMAAVMPKVKGQTDGQRVSAVVKELLLGQSNVQ